MNYKNLLGLGLVTTTLLATSPMSFAASPNPGTPLRMAKATVQILRVEVTYDNATGKGDHKRTPVCTQNLDIAVSDSKNHGYVRPGNVQCMDKVNGQDIKIYSSAMFALERGSIIEGTPETDFKYLAVYSINQYMNNSPGNQLPDIPANVSYSKDLNQKFFGAVSSPKQFVTCPPQEQPIPGDPNPRPQSSKCTVENPLGYQVVWEVEDSI